MGTFQQRWLFSISHNNFFVFFWTIFFYIFFGQLRSHFLQLLKVVCLQFLQMQTARHLFFLCGPPRQLFGSSSVASPLCIVFTTWLTYLLTHLHAHFWCRSNATKQQINGGRSRGICKVHWWHFLKIKISPQVCLDVGVGVASLGLLHLRCCCCSRDKKVSFGFAIDWRQVTTFTHTPKWEVLQIQWIASK